ncbi:MAG: VanZ family protein [Eubacteriales bacterium]|nr:VanZ family protein [Eubacteriales bacterium]
MRYFENAVVMLPIAAVLAAIAYCPFFIWRKGKRDIAILKHVANYTLVGYFLMLVWVVIFWASPSPSIHNVCYRVNLVPFSEIIYAYTEDGGAWSSQVMWNVFMFIPLGFLLPCVFERLRNGAWKTILICLAITICIEIVQLMIGRTADIDDVLANLVGGVFGHAVYVLAEHWFRNVKATECILSSTDNKKRRVLAWLVVCLTLGVPTTADIILKLCG